MARLRQRESADRAAAATGRADWTQYMIRTPAGESEPLCKRRAVLWLVQALREASVSCTAMQEAIAGPRFGECRG